jgi:NTP pyrophosphatase (non-canonical NTP hydrolase)
VSDITEVLADIADERARQDEKWGDQSGHPYLLWNAILGEEVGEVSRVLLEDLDAKRLRAELVQIAAVAVAWVETIDKRG